MSALVHVEPFQLVPNFGEQQLRDFMSYCAAQDVSDVVFQTGDRVTPSARNSAAST